MDSGISNVIDILNNNYNYLFNKDEIKNYKTSWFENIKVEKSICLDCGESCEINSGNGKYFSICSNGHINEIKDTDLNKYKFRIDYLYEQIIKKFSIEEIENSSDSNIKKIGTYNQLPVYFSLPNALISAIFEFITSKLKNDIATIIVTKKVHLSSDFIEGLKSFGIFIADVFDDTSLDLLLNEHQHIISLFTNLNSMSIDVKISNLKLTATTASGDDFEDETYKIISRVFNLCIPFGNQFKGFAIPDGLVADGKNDKKSRILFYDCKSFNSEYYKHKAGIPMQVNYYESFLSDFFQFEEYENQGFIIFSNSFDSDEVKNQIIGSPQWKYVFKNSNIYYIGVEELEHLQYLYDKFYNGNYYDGKAVFDLLFGKDLSLIKNNEVKSVYKKLFPSTYENYHFLGKREVEFAFIYGLIKGYLEKNRAYLTLSNDLIDIIALAKHDSSNKGINPPQFFDLYAKLIEGIKRGELGELDCLDPLSIFAMMKEIERYQSNTGISQLGDKWKAILKLVMEKIEQEAIA